MDHNKNPLILYEEKFASTFSSLPFFSLDETLVTDACDFEIRGGFVTTEVIIELDEEDDFTTVVSELASVLDESASFLSILFCALKFCLLAAKIGSSIAKEYINKYIFRKYVKATTVNKTVIKRPKYTSRLT